LRRQVLRQRCDDRLVLRIRGEVHSLGRIVPLAPERQTPAVVADAVAHDVATGLARSARILADRDLAGRSGGVVQKPLQAAAVETGRPQTSASVG